MKTILHIFEGRKRSKLTEYRKMNIFLMYLQTGRSTSKRIKASVEDQHHKNPDPDLTL